MAAGVRKDGGSLFRQLLSNDAPPFVQFLKYAFCGGVATGVQILSFFLIGFFLIPCVDDQDIVVKVLHLTAPVLGDAVRARNALFSNAIAFVLANAVCYVLNRLFVFKPGRHSMWVECLLFFAVSGVSMALGLAVQTWLIHAFGIQTTIAFGACLVTSLAINYVMRKFFVFNG